MALPKAEPTPFPVSLNMFIIIDDEGKMLVVVIFILITNLKSLTIMRKKYQQSQLY